MEFKMTKREKRFLAENRKVLSESTGLAPSDIDETELELQRIVTLRTKYERSRGWKPGDAISPIHRMLWNACWAQLTIVQG